VRPPPQQNQSSGDKPFAESGSKTDGRSGQPQPRCPQCSSDRLYKDGLRYLSDGSTVQRYLCRNCGYRFSETHLNFSNKSQQVQKIQTLILNSPKALTIKRQGSREAFQAKRPPALAGWWKPWPKWKPVVKSGLRGPHRRQQTSKVKSWNSLGS
jgi:DNA-directed RNA polymerase subunit RPC12/RpoP